MKIETYAAKFTNFTIEDCSDLLPERSIESGFKQFSVDHKDEDCESALFLVKSPRHDGYQMRRVWKGTDGVMLSEKDLKKWLKENGDIDSYN